MEPVGAREVASLVGVAIGTVHAWRQRGLLPRPRWTVSGSPAWDREEVLAWARQTGRLPEEPEQPSSEAPRAPLSVWQKALARHAPLPQDELVLWLTVVEASGRVAEGLRKESIAEINSNLARLFAAYAAFAESCAVDLEKVIWRRFPHRCPYCLVQTNCVCLADPDVRSDPADPVLRRAVLDTSLQPATLDDWVAMFDRLYGRVNRLMPVSVLGFHLAEEIGEVAGALVTPPRGGVVEELGDVFAWIAALIIRSDQGALSNLLWRAFPAVRPALVRIQDGEHRPGE